MEDRRTQTVHKIPLLGDIPWVGPFFQRNELNKEKTELLIFLTPHVASSPALLGQMSKDETNGTKLTPHAVEPGAFEDHIRGMQRGGTTRPTEGEVWRPGDPTIVIPPTVGRPATTRPAESDTPFAPMGPAGPGSGGTAPGGTTPAGAGPRGDGAPPPPPPGGEGGGPGMGPPL